MSYKVEKDCKVIYCDAIPYFGVPSRIQIHSKDSLGRTHVMMLDIPDYQIKSIGNLPDKNK